MADKVKVQDLAPSKRVNLKEIILVFKILSNTDRSKVVDFTSHTATKNNFDELLLINLRLLWHELENNDSLKDLSNLKTYFCGYFEQKSNSNLSKETLGCTEYDAGTSVLKHNSNDANLNLSAEGSGCITKGNTIQWVFCQICLQALSCLKNTLQAMKNLDNAGKGPAVDLSISDQQVVKTVIQLIVVVGICPNFVKGVGIPIEQRTGFSGALGSRQDTKCPKCLYKCVMSLMSCLTEPTLSLVILSKHLADILAALMQLGYCQELCDKRTDPSPSMNNKLTGNASICEGGVLISKLQQDECKKTLNNIVSKMYQPLIIRELLFLQGSMSGHRPNPKECDTGTAVDKKSTARISKQKEFGKLEKACEERKDDTRTPKWMKDVCGHLLSKCLMKKNGVQSVLRAVLEGVSGWYCRIASASTLKMIGIMLHHHFRGNED